MTRRPHGVVYGLLAASVAINLVGAGYLGYTGFRPRPPKTVENTIDFVSGRYEGKAGEAIKDRLEAHRQELRSALDDMKDARRETRRTMRDTPFDKARVEAAFAAARDKGQAFQSVIHKSIVEGVSAVEQKDRDAIGGGDPD